jgi:hypothetical protein
MGTEQCDLLRPHDQVVRHQSIWTGLRTEERKLQYNITLAAESINTRASVSMETVFHWTGTYQPAIKVNEGGDIPRSVYPFLSYRIVGLTDRLTSTYSILMVEPSILQYRLWKDQQKHPDKLLKQCSVLWVCANYDTSHVASCSGQQATWDVS